MKHLSRFAIVALAITAGALPSPAADVSIGYVQGPGGWYRQDDRSGPYTINSAGTATLVGQITGATINSVSPNTVSEVPLIDKSNGSTVIRRTIIKADGTTTTSFVDISGSTVNPAMANLVLPSQYGNSGGGGTAPVLASLSFTPTSATVGQLWSATISGQTSGSSIAASSSDGTSLSVSGSVVSGTFAAAGTPNVFLVETLAGATGSPKTTVTPVSVSTAGVDYTNPINTFFFHYL